MDKRKGILNIGASLLSKAILLFAALYIRRLLILYIGNEVNGLNSLYASIIGLLSVAELGVGSAIVFSMYRPIVDGNNKTVVALYCLYKKMYAVIGIVIFLAGIVLMPFLPALIDDYQDIDANVNITFFLTLLSVVISYLYSAKTSLIEAYKNNYITTGILTISKIARSALQIAAIIVLRSYIAYLICQIIETLLVWIMTEYCVRKLHGDVIGKKEKLDDSTKNEVIKNIKAMFMHKIGAVMVGAIDSMIISAYIGVAILGKYSNYTAIVGAMVGVIALFFTPLTAVVGHMCAAESKKRARQYFDYFYSLNYVIGVIFFLGFYAVIDNIIVMFFGPDLVMSRQVPYIISLNCFIGYMRQSPLLFRDASGAFYYDRWKPFAEGVSNLILSILLVNALPDEYSVVGVIAATIITNLLICDIIEPHILFKYVFDEPAKKFYVRNYSYIAVFAASLVLIDKITVDLNNNFAEFLVNGTMSIGCSLATLFLVGLADKTFASGCKAIMVQLRTWAKEVYSKIKRYLKR